MMWHNTKDPWDHFEIGSSPLSEVSYVEDVGLVCIDPCLLASVRRADGCLTEVRSTFELYGSRSRRYHNICVWVAVNANFGESDVVPAVVGSFDGCLSIEARWQESQERHRTCVVHIKTIGWSR